MIFVTAIEHNEVLGAGFQMVALPAASDSARFLKTLNGLRRGEVEKATRTSRIRRPES